MVAFVFYGYWGRARCKVFAFLTYRRQVMAVFVLHFRSKTSPVKLYCTLNKKMLSLKRKNLRLAPERVEISLPVCHLMPNRPPE